MRRRRLALLFHLGLAVCLAGARPARKGRSLPYFVGGSFASEPAETEVGDPGERDGTEDLRFRGDPRGALREAERRLRIDRSRASSWVLKARALAELGRTRPAIDAFEEALRMDARHPGARVGLGKLLVETGQDAPRGARLLQESLTRTSADVPALLGLALFHKRREDRDRARAYFEAALKLDPVNSEAHHGLGTVELREGRSAQALRRFRKVTELDPRHSKAWIAQALVYTRLGERDRAVAAYGRAWHALGGKGNAAREVLQKMRELDPYAKPEEYPLPSPPVTMRRPPAGLARAAKPERVARPRKPPEKAPAPRTATAAASPMAGALPDLSSPPLPPKRTERPGAETLRDGVDAAGRLQRMAELYARYGLYEEATSSFHALIARDPASAQARTAQARIEEMRSYLRPDDERRITQLRALADFLRGRRDRRGAREVLTRVLLVAPEDHLALKDLAFLAAREGDLEEALAFAGRSLESSPGFTDAILVKAYALARQRKFRQALVLYRAVLEADPPPRIRLYASSMERALEVFADGP